MQALPDRPLISVVMPVYNAARYVGEAISSILAQTYDHLEFIIADDGSTDDSAAIIRDFAARDERIRPLFLAHAGHACTANRAVQAARGALIARLDHDDVALPQRLAVQVDWLRRTGVDICGSHAKRFGAASALLWYPETHQAIQHELLFRLALLHSTVIMRTEILQAHRYDEHVTAEDYELWTRLAPRYRLGNVPQVLLKYRAHGQQLHVARASAFANDVNRLRQRYFCELFPTATEQDYRALACVAEQRACADLDELERAGTWLARLAQPSDTLLRRRMAARWRTACRIAAPLGMGAYRLYRQLAPQMGAAEIAPLRLQLACALRRPAREQNP